jgi:hypothetical protein
MNEAMKTIKEYVLHPDHLGCHLRQMAEEMGKQMAEENPTDAEGSPGVEQEIRSSCLDRAAETIACFIHLAWCGSGPQDYAPRALEVLLGLQGRMCGMDPDSTWAYALCAFNTDILSRLARAASLVVTPDLRTTMIHHFLGNSSDHYLRDIAGNIVELHWQRRHGPNCLDADNQKTTVPGEPRGGAVLERHLRRSAIEGLATYIEQSNIARGTIETPTDPLVVLRDRIEIQLARGGKNAQTWAESGWELAEGIEARFGTSAGRREARRSRNVWKAISCPT